MIPTVFSVAYFPYRLLLTWDLFHKAGSTDSDLIDPPEMNKNGFLAQGFIMATSK